MKRSYGFWRKGNRILLDGKKEGLILGEGPSHNGYNYYLRSFRVLMYDGHVVDNIPLTTDIYLGTKGLRKKREANTKYVI